MFLWTICLTPTVLLRMCHFTVTFLFAAATVSTQRFYCTYLWLLGMTQTVWTMVHCRQKKSNPWTSPLKIWTKVPQTHPLIVPQRSARPLQSGEDGFDPRLHTSGLGSPFVCHAIKTIIKSNRTDIQVHELYCIVLPIQQGVSETATHTVSKFISNNLFFKEEIHKIQQLNLRPHKHT